MAGGRVDDEAVGPRRLDTGVERRHQLTAGKQRIHQRPPPQRHTLPRYGRGDGRLCGFGGTEWLLFANGPAGSEANREGDEVLLRRWELPARVEVSGSRGYAAFKPRPGAAATVTFEFRHPGAPDGGRSVVVSQTGRPRISGLEQE